jgi:hypothetical protein
MLPLQIIGLTLHHRSLQLLYCCCYLQPPAPIPEARQMTFVCPLSRLICKYCSKRNCNQVEIINTFRMNKMLIDKMQFKGMKGLDKETKTERKQREKVLTSMAVMGFHKRHRVAVSLNTRYIHYLHIGWIHIPHSSNKQ